MKDCAFYYDVPALSDERAMRRKLQSKYDPLLQPGWRPPLTSRKDLLTWACRQYNQSLEIKGSEEPPAECENYQALLFEFGPDYDKLRAKLGHVRGLFD